MQIRKATRKHRWGVILAGGEGVRLRNLTRLVSGDDRPKQFCRLIWRQNAPGTNPAADPPHHRDREDALCCIGVA